MLASFLRSLGSLVTRSFARFRHRRLPSVSRLRGIMGLLSNGTSIFVKMASDRDVLEFVEWAKQKQEAEE